MPPKETSPIAIRISEDLWRDIDREQSRREKELGAKLSRNAVIATLLREALAAREVVKKESK